MLNVDATSSKTRSRSIRSERLVEYSSVNTDQNKAASRVVSMGKKFEIAIDIVMT
jgi:hypothetical protein